MANPANAAQIIFMVGTSRTCRTGRTCFGGFVMQNDGSSRIGREGPELSANPAHMLLSDAPYIRS